MAAVPTTSGRDGGRKGATAIDITVHTAAASLRPDAAAHASMPDVHSYPCTTSKPGERSIPPSRRTTAGEGRRRSWGSSRWGSWSSATRAESGPGSLMTETSWPRSRTAPASSMAFSWLPPTSMACG
jgi:hypothetical protein